MKRGNATVKGFRVRIPAEVVKMMGLKGGEKATVYVSYD